MELNISENVTQYLGGTEEKYFENHHLPRTNERAISWLVNASRRAQSFCRFF